MQRLEIRLRKDEFAWLRKEAKKQNISLAELVRVLIKEKCIKK